MDSSWFIAIVKYLRLDLIYSFEAVRNCKLYYRDLIWFWDSLFATVYNLFLFVVESSPSPFSFCLLPPVLCQLSHWRIKYYFIPSWQFWSSLFTTAIGPVYEPLLCKGEVTPRTLHYVNGIMLMKLHYITFTELCYISRIMLINVFAKDYQNSITLS